MSSRLAQEIAEQPQAASRLLDTAAERTADVAVHLVDHEIEHVTVVARGSSDNAARYAQYLFGIRRRLPVSLATPSLLSVYDVAPRFDRGLVVGVSQSGQSPDVVAVLAAATDQGRPTIAITNEPRSPLAREASIVIDLCAGVESAVAATKTYVNSLLALAMVAVALDGDPGRRKQALSALNGMPAALRAVLATQPGRPPSGLAQSEHLIVVGRGLNYSTAFEVALKLRELTGIHSEAFSPPDLLHGPIGAVDRGSTVLLIAPREPSLPSVRAVVPALRERGAILLAVTDDVELADQVDHVLPLGDQPPAWLTPATAVVPGQVLALNLTRSLGRDPDHPEGLSKVTRTR